MSTPIEIIQRLVEEVWNAGHLESLETFFTASYLNNGQPSSPEDLREWERVNRGAFPDTHYVIEDIFAADDNRVVIRWSATGTHEGMMWGVLPATHKTVSWTGVHIFRLEGRQIVEVWSLADTLEKVRQLGARLSLTEI